MVFLAGRRGVFYLLVSVCSITGLFLSGLVREQGGLMGKAHLWRSAQSAPSLRAGGGCRLSVKRIKAVTSCPVCVTE